MSESDKSGKPELTSDDFKRINEWVGEIYYKSPPHTDNWNELQRIAERATLHERSAAQARIAELEAAVKRAVKDISTEDGLGLDRIVINLKKVLKP